jgi:signal transduction histidine kinase
VAIAVGARPLPSPARALVAAVVGGGACAVALAIARLADAPPSALLAVVAIAVAVAAADQFTLTLPHGRQDEQFSLSDAVWVAAIVLAHPGAPTLGAAAGALGWQAARRLPATKLAFNVGRVALSLAAAELVWSLPAHTPAPTTPAAWGMAILAMSAAFVVNATTVALVIALVNGTRFRDVALGSLKVSALVWAGNVAIGLLAALAWYEHPIGIVLVAIPLGLLYLADREWVAGLVEREQMEDMAQTADQIASHGDTSRRLPRAGTEGRVEQLTASLSRVLEQLDGATGRERLLMRKAAEELNGPVRAIRHDLDRSGSADPLVRGELDRLERVLDEMAAVAGAGNPGAIRPVDADLGGVFERVAERARPILGDRLEVAPPADGAVACVDARWLERALMHLLDNAAVHGREPGQVQLRARKVALGWRLEVADDGGGVPAGHEEAVFEPFYRLSGGARGSGLGLALVRSVAKAHGGSAGVCNQPGVGVTFWMRVPG